MLRTRLTLLIIALLVSQLVASGFLLWTIDRSQYYLERRRISYEEVNAYMWVGEAVFLHNQLIRDAEANPSPSMAQALQESAERMDRRVSEVRDISNSERELVGQREPGLELPGFQRLNVLTGANAEMQDKTAALAGHLADGGSVGDMQPSIDRLHRLLEFDLSEVVQAAFLQEDAEARQADADAQALVDQLIRVAIGMTAVGVTLAIIALYFLGSRIRRPMAVLMRGVGNFTQGDLSYRTGLKGQDEFAQLSQALDGMADRLASQRQELLNARDNLSETVAARTSELAEANAQLQRTDALRREFLANVSHELRTPITVIRGEADVTLRGAEKPVEDYRHALNCITSQAALMTQLVDDLLLLARSGEGALELHPEAVALKPFLTEAMTHAAALSQTPPSITLEEGEDLWVEADPDRLLQVILILLDNAVRYAGNNADIRLKTMRRGNMAAFSVSDNGPGMEPDEAENVFERFFRGEAGRCRAPDGTGLGLNIARALVDAHGGDITLESEKGRGTTVTVWLPRANGTRDGE